MVHDAQSMLAIKVGYYIARRPRCIQCIARPTDDVSADALYTYVYTRRTTACFILQRGAGGRFSPQYNATNQRLAFNCRLFAKQQQTYGCVRWVNPGSWVLQIIVCEVVVHNKGRLHEGGGRADADTEGGGQRHCGNNYFLIIK